MKSITELSKDELLNLLYNKFDVMTFHLCYCIVCEPENNYIISELELGYICDECNKKMDDKPIIDPMVITPEELQRCIKDESIYY